MSAMTARWRQVEGEALFAYHWLVGRSIRWRIHGRANLTLAKSRGRPLLWAFWHEQLTPFFMYGERFLQRNDYLLIRVGDERGDILGHMAERFGVDALGVDMQGNPMASGRAVLRVIQAMKQGKHSFLAPDGPDGPPFEPKKGVAFLARKAEATVLPIGALATPLLRLPRWDQYQIPLPFSTIHLHIGRPIFVNRKDKDTVLLKKIANALSDIRHQAQDDANVPRWP